jgi:hypothetical protein
LTPSSTSSSPPASSPHPHTRKKGNKIEIKFLFFEFFCMFYIVAS